MEIDEINLQDEQTSGFLLKYLNGEISFHEWLQLQSADHTSEGNVLGEEITPNEVDDVELVDQDCVDHETIAENYGLFCFVHFSISNQKRVKMSSCFLLSLF